jgi:hypothetical protein
LYFIPSVDERRRRLEGEEAVKKEEEQAEVKKKEERVSDTWAYVELAYFYAKF